MRKNFDMDAAIRRALRESIEAHAHEWEPKFETGVGPVGDDAPFDKKVSGDVNECGDKEGCCPKCGKEKCECGDMNEGTIPGDSHEWEPGFETGVGPVGDDSPFTKAVNESLMDTNDWEEGSFGAPNHRKEGIAFADGADECGNGVVATSQKNSGEVVSKDNLSEGEDEESNDEAFEGVKALFNKGKAFVNDVAYQAQDAKREAATAKAGNYGQQLQAANQELQKYQNSQEFANAIEQYKNQLIANKKKELGIDKLDAQQQKYTAKAGKAEQSAQNHYNNFRTAQTAADKGARYEQGYQQTLQPQKESKDNGNDVIAEERDRFFNIINRIEKLYD